MEDTKIIISLKEYEDLKLVQLELEKLKDPTFAYAVRVGFYNGSPMNTLIVLEKDEVVEGLIKQHKSEMEYWSDIYERKSDELNNLRKHKNSFWNNF